MLVIDIALLIIWIIAGMLVFIPAIVYKNKTVDIWMYSICWFVLILQLIKNLI